MIDTPLSEVMRGDAGHLYVRALACTRETETGIERAVPEGFTPKRDDTVIAIVSEPKVDRAGDVVVADWRLGRYRANPVILWGHDRRTPAVGRAIKTELAGEKLVQEILFDGTDDLGASIASKYAAGFLRAFSVGFRSHKRAWRTELPEDDPHRVGPSVPRWRGGEKLAANELLEVSAVNVPMLQTALAVRRSDDDDDADPADAAFLERFKWALRNDSELVELLRAALPATPSPTPGPLTLADLLTAS